MMRETIAMLLAGGAGSRLNILAKQRAKPAVPFGGMYRIIDFTLSNIMNSGIDNVGILTQYKPLSLMEHIGIGRAWDLTGRFRSAKILPPRTGDADSDWYRGTADAVYQNLDYIRSWSPKYVVVLSGDHIYQMDYAAMVEFHTTHDADLTIAVMRVPISDASRFGIAVTDDEHRIVAWQEKPAQPRNDLASMGIYVFDADRLGERLRQRLGSDFGHDIIPVMVDEDRVFAYPFSGYWRDVGTLKSYWDANMDLLEPRTGIDLARWSVRTNLDEPGRADRVPARIAPHAAVTHAMVAPGCTIAGTVCDSILSPGVRIDPDVVVERSVIMHDTVIEAGVRVHDAIIDKNVTVGAGAIICPGECDGTPVPNRDHPDHLSEGLTVIGKGARIGGGQTIGRNCIVYPNCACARDAPVPDGATVRSDVDDGTG